MTFVDLDARVSTVLAERQRLVREAGLPEPLHQVVTTRRIELEMRTPADVDAWAEYLRLPPALDNNIGEYGTAAFRTAGVWCGAAFMAIYCKTPTNPTAPRGITQ